MTVPIPCFMVTVCTVKKKIIINHFFGRLEFYWPGSIIVHFNLKHHKRAVDTCTTLLRLRKTLDKFKLQTCIVHCVILFPCSFCELSTRFSVDVTESKGKDYLPQLVSIIVVTLGSAVLLYLSYVHYTKQTLERHQENEEEQQRLQELK